MTARPDEVVAWPGLPVPAVYMRDTDGRLEAKIGGEKPPDRSGGYSTPWTFLYSVDQVKSYAETALQSANARLAAVLAELGALESLAVDMDNFGIDLYQGGGALFDFAGRAREIDEAVRRAAAGEGDGKPVQPTNIVLDGEDEENHHGN